MTQRDADVLRERREALRRQLRAQRELIALRIDPPTVGLGEYPRSNTMRFLTQRPQLAAALGSMVTARLFGPRALKGLAMAWTVVGMVRAARRRAD